MLWVELFYRGSNIEYQFTLLFAFGTGAVIWAAALLLLLAAIFRSFHRHSLWTVTLIAMCVWPLPAIALATSLRLPTVNKMVAEAGYGNQDAVARAIAHGIDIDAPSHHTLGFDPRSVPPTPGHTALTAAVFVRKYEMVVYLLDHGADIDRVDGVGRSPIMEATLQGDPKIVQLLLDRGAKLNTDAEGKVAESSIVQQMLAGQTLDRRADYEQVLEILQTRAMDE